MKHPLHFLGFHTWEPQPQRGGDFIWGYRTWKCSCGKEEVRKVVIPDKVKEVIERVGTGEK